VNTENCNECETKLIKVIDLLGKVLSWIIEALPSRKSNWL
jgi:hypothetical protein